MLYDLRPIASTTVRPAPRLEITPERVAMVRRFPGLPGRALRHYRRDQLDSVQFHTGKQLIDSRLELVDEQAVRRLTEEGRERFLHMRFDDDAVWILEGDDAELERARTALVAPTRNLEVVSDPKPAPRVEETGGTAGLLMPWLARVGVICGLLGTALLIVGEIRAGDADPRVEVPRGDADAADAGSSPAPQAPGRAVLPPPEPPPGSPLARGRLSLAAAELTRRLGRRPGVYRILAEDRQATFEVYPAGRTDAIERWIWRSGQLAGPIEVAAPPLPGGRFALNDVRLDQVYRLVQDAKQRARVGAPDVELTNVVIRRGLPATRALRITVTVSGPGGQRSFVARPDGRPIR